MADRERAREVNPEGRNRKFEFTLLASYMELIQLMLNHCIQCNLLRYVSPIKGWRRDITSRTQIILELDYTQFSIQFLLLNQE